MAIDVDTKQGYERIVPNQKFHIGISILDTRDLQDVIIGSPGTQRSEEIIQSHQFNVGDSKYCRKASRKFLFGEAQSIQLVDFTSRFESLTLGRDVILVFYSGSSSDPNAFRACILLSQCTSWMQSKQHIILSIYLTDIAWKSCSQHWIYPLQPCMQPETTPTSVSALS